MSPFSELMTDTISLLKKDGTKIDGIKASVQKNKIFMDSANILVESGDLISRLMSNGGEETFEVIDPGFYEEFHGIPANYQMDVKKLGLPEAKEAVKTINYNIIGNNARINQNSIDNSVNTVTINPQITEYLEAIRAEIHRLVSDDKLNIEANDMVNAIQGQFDSGNPSKVVVSTLLNSLPAVGSIASLGSFVLACIA